MLTGETMQAMKVSDAELVSQSLGGNRDAFGTIVERYQTLISSLAYSATGNVGRSEDLAQETFVRAWKELSRLREPAKLRPWLCSIVRFLISKEFRRAGREPVCAAEPLDAISERVSAEPLPPERAISDEEFALLWRSLERIPDSYREPLVLFYREHQSIKTVARELDLSEDVVKQRLSRGRKLLQGQVLGLIEGALERTRPEQAFTMAVLASLPGFALSAKAVAAGAAVKGGTAVKTAGGLGMLGALLGPLIVFLPNYIAYRVSLSTAYSEAERVAVKSFYARVAVITLLGFIPLAGLAVWLSWGELRASHLGGLLAGCLVVVFLAVMGAQSAAQARRQSQDLTRILKQEYDGVFPNPEWEYCTRTTLFGLPLVHVRIGDRFAPLKKPVKAWIAVGHTAIGGLFALGAGAIAPVSVGGLAIGLVSMGGFAIGGVCLGGLALGVWPVFGALLIGWQAFNGCFVFAWDAAVGLVAVAHDYALGRFAQAAEVNTDVARQMIFPNPFFRLSEFTGRRWLWLNLLWMIPFTVMWLVARRRSRRSTDTEEANQLQEKNS